MKLLFLFIICIGTAACMECEMCTQTSTVTLNGELQSTSTQSPYEVCGKLEIEQEEFTTQSTTTNSMGTTVFTIMTTCN